MLLTEAVYTLVRLRVRRGCGGGTSGLSLMSTWRRRSTTGGRTSLEASEHQGERAKHLFLSLLQARVGSSLVSRLGTLAPEIIFETPFSELAGLNGIPDRAALAFNELRRGFDAAGHEGAVEVGGATVGVLGCGIDVTYPTKYKRLRAPFPRSSLRRVHRTIGSNEGLARGHRIAPRFFRNPPARYLSTLGGVGWCRRIRSPSLEGRRVSCRRSR